jgi:hypothetical protein
VRLINKKVKNDMKMINYKQNKIGFFFVTEIKRGWNNWLVV